MGFKEIKVSSFTKPQPNLFYFPQQSCIIYYFCKFSSFSYYTLLAPYRVTVDETSPNFQGAFKLRTNFLQKVLCGLLHLWSFYHGIEQIYETNTVRRVRDDPTQVFTLATSFMYLVESCTFSYIFWFRRKGILNLFHAAHKLCPVSTKLPRKDVLMLAVIIFGYIFFPSALTTQTVIVFSQHDKEGGFSNYYSGRYILRFVRDFVNPSGDSWEVKLTLSVVNVIISFCLNCFSNSVVFHLCVLPHVITYKIGSEVKEYLGHNETEGLKQVVNYHVRVKEFFAVLNETLTLPVSVFVIAVIIYFSRSLIQMLEASDVVTRITIGGYLSYVLFYLCLAAEGQAKLKMFGDFIFEHRNDYGYKESSSEVLSMLSETSCNPLGLKAYTFLITYGVLISIFSTVLTYTMVLIQFTSATPTESQGT